MGLSVAKKKRCRQPLCARCNERNPELLTIHHVYPTHRGGTDEPHNLRTLCVECHRQWHALEHRSGWSETRRGKLLYYFSLWVKQMRCVRRDGKR